MINLSTPRSVIHQIRLPLALLAPGCIVQSTSDVLISRFGRADVLWTTIFWIMPATVWLAQQACRVSSRRIVAAASGISAWGVWSGANVFAGSLLSPFETSHLAFLLFTLAISCMFSAGLNSYGKVTRKLPGANRVQHWLTGSLVLLTAVILPQSYAHLAAQSQLQNLEEALQAQRFALARRSATIVLCCRPAATVLQQSLATVVKELDSHIHMLEAVVAQPLPAAAETSAIGQRVVALMQLDRNQAALDLMRPLTLEPYSVPSVLDYCGLCCQRLKRWEASRTWYQRSLNYWLEHPKGRQRANGLISAWKGIAFAERQLDRPADAERTYLAALKTVPSAELHFLLAMHYEDQQRTASAARHASRAMAISPVSYRQRGQELLDRMSHAHIGCLQTTTSGHLH